MVKKGPLTTMKIGSTGMSTSHWCAIVALWFAPGTREGHGIAQSAPCTYSFQSRILVSTHGIQGYTYSYGTDSEYGRGTALAKFCRTVISWSGGRGVSLIIQYSKLMIVRYLMFQDTRGYALAHLHTMYLAWHAPAVHRDTPCA